MSPASVNKEKVLVIGLDGATFDLMLPWVTKGLLPNLGSIMQEGMYGDLRSVTPAESPPAWASFATGKNPGKHGVFGFYEPNPGDYTLTPINAHSNHARTLYRLLSDAGKRVITLAVPYTFPPEHLENGVVVPCKFSTPRKTALASTTHPPDVQGELCEHVGAQRLRARPSLVYRTPTAFLNDLHGTTANLLETARYLMQHKPWDFCMLVVNGVEQVEHYFYRNHEARYGGKRDRFQDAICDYYQKVDSMVGELLAHTDESTTVYIISDHGMQPFQQYFCMNLWLHDRGLLSFKQPAAKWLKRQTITAFTQLGLKNRLRRILDRHPFPEGATFSALSFDDVDFDTTQAYAYGFGSIRLNVIGRDLRGVVKPGEYERMRDTIIDGLHDLIDDQGQAFRVYRREEIYSGAHVERAPDIVVTSERYWPNGLAGVGPFSNWYGAKVEDSPYISGMHATNGIFIAKGPHIHSGHTVSDAQLIDLAPTILYSLGLPIPADMDGRPLTEIFKAQHRNLHTPRYTQTRNTAEHRESTPQRVDALYRAQPQVNLPTTQGA